VCPPVLSTRLSSLAKPVWRTNPPDQYTF
jgi:hypothetical protein